MIDLVFVLNFSLMMKYFIFKRQTTQYDQVYTHMFTPSVLVK